MLNGSNVPKDLTTPRIGPLFESSSEPGDNKRSARVVSGWVLSFSDALCCHVQHLLLCAVILTLLVSCVLLCPP